MRQRFFLHNTSYVFELNKHFQTFYQQAHKRGVSICTYP